MEGEGEAERNEKRNGGLNKLEPGGESAGNQNIGRRGEEQSTKIAREPCLSKGRVRKLSGKHGAKRNRHKFVEGRCNRLHSSRRANAAVVDELMAKDAEKEDESTITGREGSGGGGHVTESRGKEARISEAFERGEGIVSEWAE